MSKLTSAPKCVVCGSNHWLRDPHKWTDEAEDTIASLKKKALAMSTQGHKECTQEPVKRVHIEPERVHKTPDEYTKPIDEYTTKGDEYTCRQANMRQLRSNMAAELKDLPFDILNRGVVVARVVKA